MKLNLHDATAFLSSADSDCSIANVNIYTLGAEAVSASGNEKNRRR